MLACLPLCLFASLIDDNVFSYVTYNTCPRRSTMSLEGMRPNLKKSGADALISVLLAMIRLVVTRLGK